ncbi:methylated-DNA--[protein]-cysteine S-methyltransferase [Cellulomonas sp. HZM]|uniref:methylated-DNA--[protein]-cysteine S-methyltransferase n=1 Tax=Cellulomonas sp. HZM TaxID=1454010 RepID=UPI0009E0313A|nr:methylated-DNA--[protein]-cysteine S-methyltransferase [Cellulomonas sp. HZM]
MTPLRTGPASRELVHTVVGSPVGPVTLIGYGDVLTALHLPTTRPAPGTPGQAAAGIPRDDRSLRSAADQLGEYFAGERTEFDLVLDPGGTAFQQRVWAALARIPYGQTRTYGEVALDAGLDPRTSSRAVGAANGSNPIAVVVPCHRVIGADGSLTGYAGGLENKRWLLDHEQGGALFGTLLGTLPGAAPSGDALDEAAR